MSKICTYDNIYKLYVLYLIIEGTTMTKDTDHAAIFFHLS